MDHERPSHVNPGEWERLAPARLTPGGPGSTDVLGWLTRGAVALMVLSMLWLGFSIVRPLASPGDAGVPNIRPGRAVAAPTITVAERQELLDAVRATNWFDPNHEWWTHQDIAGDNAQGAPNKTDQSQAPEIAETPPRIIDGANATGLVLTAPGDLPEKLAKAYANLELRGIRMRADGKLVAMISMVSSPARPATTSYAIGDTFTDAAFADDEWRVLLIDGSRDRVYLRRADKTVELPLWKNPVLTVASAADGASAAPTGPSRDEIIAQLRAAGISEEQIAETLRMVYDGEAPQPAQAKPPEVKSVDDALGQLEKAPEEVKGIGDILKKMSESDSRPRRSDRRTLAFPDIDTYPALGGGHTVGVIDADAGVVTLNDGSRWDVSASGATRINGWGTAAAVSVFRGKGTSRAYVIVNDFTHDTVQANHLVEPKDADVESAEASDSAGG